MERLGDRGYLLTPEEWRLIVESPEGRIYRYRDDVSFEGNAGRLIEGREKHIMTVAALSSEARDRFEELCALVRVEVPPLNPSADLQSISPQTG